MSKKLVLTLNEATTRKYLELARKQTEDLVDEGCEPSGVTLTIQVAASQFCETMVFFGKHEIGEASLNWVDS